MLVGYFAVFSYFGLYDDEGGWLIALRSYHLHGSLYNHTYAQAGPFYYELWSIVYSVFGLNVNWDTGRMLTLVTWIATSLVMGIAIWVFTKRVLLGLLVELVSFLVMFLLSGVSMEAAGIAHLMGAFVLLGLALFLHGRRRVGMVIIGAACAAMVFSKVNVGLFAIIGLAAAAIICWPTQRWQVGRRLVVAAGLALLPVLLMAPAISKPTAWHYCVLELIYVVGLAGLLTKKMPRQAFSIRDIAVGVGAAIGASVLIAAGVLINGTSLWQLVYGAFFSQRGLTKTILIPLNITGPDVALAVISSALAVGVALYLLRRGTRPPWLSSIGSGYLRCAVGIWILLTISEGGPFPGWTPPGIVVAPGVTILGPGHSFLLAAPFVWVAALGAFEDEDGVVSFIRAAICITAVVGCLEGFPVAGSQMLWASLTLVPVGILCLTDGIALVAPRPHAVERAQSRALGVPFAAMALTYLALLGIVGETLSMWRNTYSANKPVRLMGASRVRLPADVVNDLRDVTAFLRQNCTTYWSIPGLNSFYFLAGQEPVTDMNSTQQWWKALDLRRQNQILAALHRVPRLCLVESVYLGEGSHAYGYEPPNVLHVQQSPLVRYMENQFVLAKTVGGGAYHVLVRRDSSTTTSVK